MKPMKSVMYFGLALLLVALTACPMDSLNNVKQEPTLNADGTAMVDNKGQPVMHAVVVPGPSPLDKGVAVVTGATAFIPVWGQIIGLVGLAVSAAGHVYQQIRTSNWQGAAISTAQGVQDVVSHLDSVHANGAEAPKLSLSSVADMIKAAIDKQHDAHEVPQVLQTALSPLT